MRTFRNFPQISRCFSTTKRHIQVCILGADTPAGQMTALLLKQNPAVAALHLQGTSRVEGMGVDFSHFDTRCRVHTYHDLNSISNSLKSADIVLMMGLNPQCRMSLPKHVMAEGPRVAKLAEECTKYAPKAMLVIAVPPVSVTLPIAAEVFRKSDWYHPGRLLGSVASAQVRANALAGHYQNLDPQIVHVPIIGGPDVDCAIPLFAHTIPASMSPKDADKLMERFRGVEPRSLASEAFGLNRMITAVALGLSGDNNANVSAFMRSNIVDICRHIVTTVKIGKHAVVHNYGLQKLHKHELIHFEETCLELKQREEMASDLVHRKDKCALPAFMIREMEKEKIERQGIIR